MADLSSAGPDTGMGQLDDLFQGFVKTKPLQRRLELPSATILLDPGERYAGAVLNKDGRVDYHLVLMAETVVGTRRWDQADAWAKQLGGMLPNRKEWLLLLSNCLDAFPRFDRYWAAEHDGEYASIQALVDFSQTTHLKRRCLHARAIRRVYPATI